MPGRGRENQEGKTVEGWRASEKTDQGGKRDLLFTW